MKVKILIPLLMIFGAIGWLVTANLKDANYFYKANELAALGDRVYTMNLRVKGRIVPGSIKSKINERPVIFTIHEEDAEVVVHYVGEAPLPDMFKDRAEAVVDGTMRRDGVFVAEHLQAKCASKYEAGLDENLADGQGGYPQAEGDSAYGEQAQPVAQNDAAPVTGDGSVTQVADAGDTAKADAQSAPTTAADKQPTDAKE